MKLDPSAAALHVVSSILFPLTDSFRSSYLKSQDRLWLHPNVQSRGLSKQTIYPVHKDAQVDFLRTSRASSWGVDFNELILFLQSLGPSVSVVFASRSRRVDTMTVNASRYVWLSPWGLGEIGGWRFGFSRCLMLSDYKTKNPKCLTARRGKQNIPQEKGQTQERKRNWWVKVCVKTALEKVNIGENPMAGGREIFKFVITYFRLF